MSSRALSGARSVRVWFFVEAIAPLSHEPTWFEWEGLLFEAGYEFALFDGLNRFYYRAEEPELQEPLSRAANVLDGYITAHCKALHDRVTSSSLAMHRCNDRLRRPRPRPAPLC